MVPQCTGSLLPGCHWTAHSKMSTTKPHTNKLLAGTDPTGAGSSGSVALETQIFKTTEEFSLWENA